jgi:hypothetical protein
MSADIKRLEFDLNIPPSPRPFCIVLSIDMKQLQAALIEQEVDLDSVSISSLEVRLTEAFECSEAVDCAFPSDGGAFENFWVQDEGMQAVALTPMGSKAFANNGKKKKISEMEDRTDSNHSLTSTDESNAGSCKPSTTITIYVSLR